MKIVRITRSLAERRRHQRLLDYTEYGVGVLVFILLVIWAEQIEAPKKWRTAIFGTVGPFWIVIVTLRRRWRFWTTWLSMAICLCFHSVVMWVLFQYVFTTNAPGWLLWSPIAFVESFFLLIAVKRVEEAFTGKKEVWRI